METDRLIKKYQRWGIQIWIEDNKLKYSAPKGAMTEERIKELSQNKEEIIKFINSQKAIKHNSNTAYEEFPLTPLQSSYLVGKSDAYDFGGIGCNFYVELDISKYDLNRVTKAWEDLIERHPMLRAVILPSGTQKILEKVPKYNIEVKEYSYENFQTEFNELRKIMSSKLHSSNEWPLFEIKISKLKEKTVLHFSIDMLIADSVSMGILLRDWLKYIETDDEMPNLEITFKDIVNFENIKLYDVKYVEKYNRDRQYWIDRIKDIPVMPNLPIEIEKDTLNYKKIEHLREEINKSIWDNFVKICSKNNVTSSGMLLTIYSEILKKWSINKDFCINVTTMNRNIELYQNIYDIVGEFTNVVLLEVKNDKKSSFIERALKIQRQLWEDLEHNNFSGVEFIREIKKFFNEDRIYPYVFTSTLGNNIQYPENLKILYRSSQTPQVLIDCQVGEKDGNLEIYWDVRESAFKEGVVKDMFKVFVKTICDVADSKIDIYDKKFPSIFDGKLSNAVTELSNNHKTEMLYDMFIDNAVKYGDKIALIEDDKKYTYKELYSKALNIAHHLKENNYKKGDKIGLFINLKSNQTISTLGVLFAGCICIPMDVDANDVEIKEIMEKISPNAVIVDEQVDEQKLNSISGNVIKLENISLRENNQCEIVKDRDSNEVAYIVNSYMKSGDFNGVCLTHKSLLEIVKSVNENIGINVNDNVLSLAKSFEDVAIYDIFGTLSAGATLILCKDDKRDNASYLANKITTDKVGILNDTNEHITEILDLNDKDFEESVSKIEKMILSRGKGDKYVYGKLSDINSELEIFSLEGVTEASIFSIYKKIEKNNLSDVVLYEKLLSNQEVYILDENMEVCPDWVIGNIYFSGELALGYCDTSLNKENFIELFEGKKRLFKTEIKARYRADKKIEILSDFDSLTSINGFLFTLSDIDNMLRTHKKIYDSKSFKIGKEHKDKIISYLMPNKVQRRDYSYLKDDFNDKFESVYEKIIKNEDKDKNNRMVKAINEFALTTMMKYLQSKDIFVDEKSYTKNQIIEILNLNQKHYSLILRWLNKLAQYNYIDVEYQNLNTIYKKRNGIFDKEDIKQDCDITFEEISDDIKDYLKNAADNIDELFAGVKKPQEILFPKGALKKAFNVYNGYEFAKYINSMAVESMLYIIKNIRKEKSKTIKILEIGAGTGSFSDHIIHLLKDEDVEYHFSDVSQFFLNNAKLNYSKYLWMRYKIFDINKGLEEQGMNEGEYDIIVSSNVMHVAKNGTTAFQKVKKLLNPEGYIVTIDAVNESPILLISMAFLYLIDIQDERKEKEQIFFDLKHYYRNFGTINADVLYEFPSEKDKLQFLNQKLFVCKLNSDHDVISNEEIESYLNNRLINSAIPKVRVIEKKSYIDIENIEKQDDIFKIEKGKESNVIQHVSNELEKKIEDIWKKILSIDTDIGTDRSFFEIGGDSLLLAQVVGAIHKNIEEVSDISWEDLMRMSLENDTIKKLSDAIKGKKYDKSNTNTKLIIQNFEDKNNDVIVIISDGTGSLTIYNSLIELIKNKYNKKYIIGYRLANYENYLNVSDENLIKTLGQYIGEDLYKQNIKKATLIGHCFGGVVALETGRYLNDLNIDNKLIMIDSKIWDKNLLNEIILENIFCHLLGVDLELHGYSLNINDFKFILKNEDYENMTPIDVLKKLKEKMPDLVTEKIEDFYQKTQVERFKVIYNLANKGSNENIEYGLKQIEYFYKIFKKSYMSMFAYKPEKYDGDIMEFIANKEDIFTKEKITKVKSMADMVSDNINKQEIEGGHISCMNKENLKKVIDLL